MNFLRESNEKCESVFTLINVYGASMMMFANIIYLITYVLISFMYAIIPGICRRAYDKAVLSFLISQALLSIAVITVGHHMLCHKPLNRTAAAIVGLNIMTFTISGVLWLLVISFDVSSTIVRFRWVPASGAKGRDEVHKFRIYFCWVFFGTAIPVLLSTILQFSPLPEDSIAKPNFHLYNVVNYRVIVHVVTVPTLTAVASNVLFIYTTVKMFNIQKSTSVISENRKKKIKEKYFLYLKLYLLMDAPYITGALGAIYEDLWLLKFIRIFQPLIMLYAVLPRDVVLRIFSGGKKCSNKKIQVAKKIVEEPA